ncbi:glycine dehydrogenase subunit 1 [Desulfohalotomaculum tongense]|uniref:aminomethyl-transferring glycine dehydrogenase subunit GcvPA n=1 Tax=Desulforadius tongensis TaxID=1216062 RepID=UPI00195A0181|nr:aminomethyl-transferring glycine dehydrogenase subunit GcvPA [Desulforadius tongensis]MBM7855252.1 glycine dehydrogenase subunit 1 [Desulforadius tongensis]
MKFIPHTGEERQQMLKELGINDLEELFAEIPEEIRLKRELNVPGPLSELEVARKLNSLAGKNKTVDQLAAFLGAGVYDHYIPSAVQHIISRSEFYTAYTPYQPEISQGVLQSIFEFQTMICQLTGMDVANASMYDGASATAEAALMACAATRRSKVLVSKTVHPQYREVLRTYASGPELQVIEVDFTQGCTDLEKLKQFLDKDVAAVIIQQPNFFGSLEDLTAAAKAAHQVKALLVTCADPVSLGLIASPGSCGADIVTGEGQGLGIPMSYGGPHLGYMACAAKLMRRMPGRIVGETKDNQGRRGYVLTLQAREQHIRREKATSNICSNQALCALAATVHLSLLGRKGLRSVAEQCLQKAYYAYEQIIKLPGYQPAWAVPFFKEFVIKTPQPPEEINRRLLDNGIIGGLDLERYYPQLKNHMLLCVTETRTKEDIHRLVALLGGDVK